MPIIQKITLLKCVIIAKIKFMGHKMIKKTKIVATLGPASDNEETMEAMVKAGVNVFRLNFSHGTHEYHKSNIDKIRNIEKVAKQEKK